MNSVTILLMTPTWICKKNLNENVFNSMMISKVQRAINKMAKLKLDRMIKKFPKIKTIQFVQLNLKNKIEIIRIIIFKKSYL